MCNYRRKFRSQISDNVDRWKSRGGKSQRREEKKREEKNREDQRRESMTRKKMQVREKVAKSRVTVFSQWCVAPKRRKVGSLKRRVWSHVVRWEMKNCTPLWREAHFEVKMLKTRHVRTTFGSWDVEKVHAVIARSTFPNQNVQNTPARRYGVGSTFRSQKYKKLTGSEHFWAFRCRFAWQAQGPMHLVKSEQNVKFCSIS